jgi:hypothetical protein
LLIRSQNTPSAGVGDEPVAEGVEVPPSGLGGDIVNEQSVVTEPLTPTVEVVVSYQTVERGWQMTAAELITDTRFVGEVGDNVITNIDDAIGLYARTKIFQGETLTKDALVQDPALIGQTEYGPSSLIPPGYVAVAVPMDRLSGVAYALNEGDYIDIMMTFYFWQIDEQFQTYLENAAVFYLEETVTTGGEAITEDGEEETTTQTNIFVLWPYGRFEELPTGDTVHVYGSENQRPVPISMILQNARVIQVGNYVPSDPIEPPTPTPEPIAEGDPTPTPQPGQAAPTATPYPDILVVALSPQQQLFLKYAIESPVDIDFALRGDNDNQLYTVQNVDINFLLERFNIEVPPGFDYSVDNPISEATPTPNAQTDETVDTTGEDS